MEYIVICRADRKEDGSKGDYELATRQVFYRYESAKEYADGCSDSREPLVVQGDILNLRYSGFEKNWENVSDSEFKEKYPEAYKFMPVKAGYLFYRNVHGLYGFWEHSYYWWNYVRQEWANLPKSVWPK